MKGGKQLNSKIVKFTNLDKSSLYYIQMVHAFGGGLYTMKSSPFNESTIHPNAIFDLNPRTLTTSGSKNSTSQPLQDDLGTFKIILMKKIPQKTSFSLSSVKNLFSTTKKEDFSHFGETEINLNLFCENFTKDLHLSMGGGVFIDLKIRLNNVGIPPIKKYGISYTLFSSGFDPVFMIIFSFLSGSFLISTVEKCCKKFQKIIRTEISLTNVVVNEKLFFSVEELFKFLKIHKIQSLRMNVNDRLTHLKSSVWPLKNFKVVKDDLTMNFRCLTKLEITEGSEISIPYVERGENIDQKGFFDSWKNLVSVKGSNKRVKSISLFTLMYLIQSLECLEELIVNKDITGNVLVDKKVLLKKNKQFLKDREEFSSSRKNSISKLRKFVCSKNVESIESLYLMLYYVAKNLTFLAFNPFKEFSKYSYSISVLLSITHLAHLGSVFHSCPLAITLGDKEITEPIELTFVKKKKGFEIDVESIGGKISMSDHVTSLNDIYFGNEILAKRMKQDYPLLTESITLSFNENKLIRNWVSIQTGLMWEVQLIKLPKRGEVDDEMYTFVIGMMRSEATNLFPTPKVELVLSFVHNKVSCRYTGTCLFSPGKIFAHRCFFPFKKKFNLELNLRFDIQNIFSHVQITRLIEQHQKLIGKRKGFKMITTKFSDFDVYWDRDRLFSRPFFLCNILWHMDLAYVPKNDLFTLTLDPLKLTNMIFIGKVSIKVNEVNMGSFKCLSKNQINVGSFRLKNKETITFGITLEIEKVFSDLQQVENHVEDLTIETQRRITSKKMILNKWISTEFCMLMSEFDVKKSVEFECNGLIWDFQNVRAFGSEKEDVRQSFFVSLKLFGMFIVVAKYRISIDEFPLFCCESAETFYRENDSWGFYIKDFPDISKEKEIKFKFECFILGAYKVEDFLFNTRNSFIKAISLGVKSEVKNVIVNLKSRNSHQTGNFSLCGLPYFMEVISGWNYEDYWCVEIYLALNWQSLNQSMMKTFQSCVYTLSLKTKNEKGEAVTVSKSSTTKEIIVCGSHLYIKFNKFCKIEKDRKSLEFTIRKTMI